MVAPYPCQLCIEGRHGEGEDDEHDSPHEADNPDHAHSHHMHGSHS